MSGLTIHLSHIGKSYGSINALVDFDCVLHEGVYALLGPNGSGKTTLMNILTGNIRQDSGVIRCNGRKIEKEDRRFRSMIGYMPQYCEMIPEFSCLDFLHYMAVLKGIDRKAVSKQIEVLLKKFELDDVKNRKISSFSGGMKQRLMLIQAFLGKPRIVLLDEPTAGLDPKQRVLVKNFISEQSLGKTVVIATHIIGDIENIACGVICLKKGENIFCGEPSALADKAKGLVWLYTAGSDERDSVKAKFRVISMSGESEKRKYRILSPSKPFETAIAVKPTLEDAYMLLYGEEHEADSI